ncbi:MAG: thioredoxin domain-containing protein [Rhodospirillales bacterium]
MSLNLLAAETSPYLLQHKDNPVHWRPWGEATLAEAARLDRPILLSVGYAACHWCHVMAHESFENEATARLMNELFINVKVDREERPDIDGIYQAALQMLGEHGGWPLTMFLTPRGEPFWGGTYFPPEARWGKPAFSDVLQRVAHVYHRQKETVTKNVAALREGLDKMGAPKPGNGMTAQTLDDGATMALRLVDPIRGGTAGAPKFPQPVFFRLLWRAWRRTRATMFREAVTLTLDELCKGGIYDHLGGGFARYSTDDAWLVPHFEKMLYDNALLIELLSEVWLETRSPLYAARVRESIDWAMAEMRVSDDGDGAFAFASALDADSEGVEGKYYVWTAEEIEAVLGDPSAAFGRAYDVRRHGNWEGLTILNLSRNPDAAAAVADPGHTAARAALREARASRVPPGRDDKVLADWNGLMIAALVAASTTFGEPRWLDAARAAFAFVITRMADGDRLHHVWRAGVARHPGILDDYANMARAALALHGATGDAAYLAQARAWVATADRHHWDGAQGGWFLAADDTTDVLVRAKPVADNPVPSGNGTMVEVLTRLWLLTGEDAFHDQAAAAAQLFSGDNPQYLLGIPGLLASAELLQRMTQVAIVGDRHSPATKALLRAVQQAPAAPMLVVSLQSPDAPPPAPPHPAAGKAMVDGNPTAYLCVGQTCSPPLQDAGRLRDALARV